jgi:hypothetical protein
MIEKAYERIHERKAAPGDMAGVQVISYLISAGIVFFNKFALGPVIH